MLEMVLGGARSPDKWDDSSTDSQESEATAPAPTAPAASPADLLDESIAASIPEVSFLDRILETASPRETLAVWIRHRFEAGAEIDRGSILRGLSTDIAMIDVLLNDQINAIIHSPPFQKLEATWRGLHYLCNRCEEHETLQIKIRVLNATWEDIARDAERAMEFDQSQFFRRVYNEEFGMAGGEPFGLLLGDYEVAHRVSPAHPIDDLQVLQSISQVAAAAFAPFVTSASPEIFGVDRFDQLERPMNISRSFEQLEFLKWRRLRELEDARFLGLVLPRILMRLPYSHEDARPELFCFKEDVSGPDSSKYLWGNAIYAFGSVAIRAFSQSAWLADIRGVTRGQDAGGLVTGLPIHRFGTREGGVSRKSSTDLVITDQRERDYTEQGFMPLCHCKDTGHSAFYTCFSMQKAKTYDSDIASVNARISTMLQYMLCVSRFAHYVKVIARDKVGQFGEAEEVEDYLTRWLARYITVDDTAEESAKSQFPLREGRVRIREIPGKPGSYMCAMHLRPHFQLSQLIASIRLQTQLNAV